MDWDYDDNEGGMRPGGATRVAALFIRGNPRNPWLDRRRPSRRVAAFGAGLQAHLQAGLDEFVEASLKMGLEAGAKRSDAA